MNQNYHVYSSITTPYGYRYWCYLNSLGRATRLSREGGNPVRNTLRSKGLRSGIPPSREWCVVPEWRVAWSDWFAPMTPLPGYRGFAGQELFLYCDSFHRRFPF